MTGIGGQHRKNRLLADDGNNQLHIRAGSGKALIGLAAQRDDFRLDAVVRLHAPDEGIECIGVGQFQAQHGCQAQAIKRRITLGVDPHILGDLHGGFAVEFFCDGAQVLRQLRIGRGNLVSLRFHLRDLRRHLQIDLRKQCLAGAVIQHIEIGRYVRCIRRHESERGVLVFVRAGAQQQAGHYERECALYGSHRLSPGV